MHVFAWRLADLRVVSTHVYRMHVVEFPLLVLHVMPFAL